MNIRQRLTALGHALTGWHTLPGGITAKVTPHTDADVLEVHWQGDKVRITHEHDCEG